MAGFNNATDFYPRITGQLTIYPGPINQVTATVDNNVGTPHVDVQTEYTADGMNINFDFHDMGIPGTDLTVLQPLTEQQKANARQNINAQEVLTFDSAPTQGSQNPVTSGGVYAAEQAIASDVADIEAVIPAAATSQNQLADKEYVDDSINRSSAFFRGNFETRAALMAVPWQTTDPDAPNYVSNNDYAYVADDETHEDESWRYIYVLEEGGSNNGWAAQYRVNESPLTTEQLAAINSGITSASVAQIETNRTGLASHVADHSNPHQVTKAQVGLGNVDNTSDADKPVSTAQQAALDALKDDVDSLYDPETASGDIVTIEDADPVLVDELVVDIQPVQDLHGQSAPYPAGGGKNKLPLTLLSIKTANTAGTWNGNTFTHNNGMSFEVQTDSAGNVIGVKANGTVAITTDFYLVPNGDYSAFSGMVLNGCPANGGANKYCMYVALLAAPYSSFGVDVGSGVTLDTIPSSTCKIFIRFVNYTASNLMFYPMIRPATESDPTFAPYSNECPISGWTGAKITDCGKNLINPNTITAGKRVTNTGALADSSVMSVTDFIEVKAGESYYLLDGVAASSFYTGVFYDRNKEVIGGIILSETSLKSDVVTIPAQGAFVRLNLYNTSIGTTASFNYPSTDTTYHAYNGSQIDVSWTDEGTVYGGTLTYIGGGKYSLQATKAKKTITGFSTYSQGSVNAFGTLPLDGAPSTSGAVAADFLCSALNPTTAGGSYTCRRVDSTLYCYFPLGTSSADATALVSGADVVYPLDTLPSPIILDAEDIELLEGTNNIFADAGPITIKFAKGALAKVISNLTARINALEAQA
ncbi:MAG: hypothetical protein IKR93_08985 [Firmicutes bacterium]|nr:hypothetical protein [Bacillota bacterium]